MTTTLEDLIGTKLVWGIPGTKVTPEDIKLFKDTHAAGIIFYRINFESPDQLIKLIRDLEEALQRKLLVCVDHEGGRVIMYRDGVTIFPDNLTFGQAGKIEWAEKAGEIAAQELRALGTDINFSPVLDVLTEAYSPNIGIRSFGLDWKTVADMGCAYIKGLQKGGVSATAKHFPGKGHAPVDAHLKLPTIQSTWDEMKQIHLQPFLKAIQQGIDVIMTSHPYYPKLDPNKENIATFSRRIVFDYLRRELGYKGLISSDDLEMGAIKDICSIDVAAVKTVAAGHDLVLSCHDRVSQYKCFEGLRDAYKGKLLPLNELEESVDRIEQLKAKRPNRFQGTPKVHADGPALAKLVSTNGVKIFQDNSHLIPLSKGNRNDVGVVFPQLSSFSAKIMIERDFDNEKKFLQDEFGLAGIKPETEIYAIDPSETDIQKAAALAVKSEITIFFCFDAHLYSNELKLLTAIQKASRKFVLVCMRDPYDKEYLRPQDAGITAFGFRGCQLRAVIEKLSREN